LKKVLVFAVLAAVLLQGVNRWVIYIDFQLNRAFIAKNLCVKKEVKNNCCQGSCQLRKRLKESNTPKNNQKTSRSKREFEQLLFAEMPSKISVFPNAVVNASTTFHYGKRLTERCENSFFHPPIG
jgi:hypothetical protein